MRQIRTELKGLLNIKLLTVFAIFLLFYNFVALNGMKNYNDVISQCNEFEKLEQIRLNKTINDISNGRRGLLVLNSLMVPTPLFSLFQYSVKGNIHSTWDNLGIVFDHSTKISKNIPKNSIICFDVARYFIVLLSLLVSLFGLLTFQNKELIRFKLNFFKKIRMFFVLYISRYLIVVISILIVFSNTLLLFSIKGITINKTELQYLIVYFFIVTLMMALFLLFGFSGGLVKKIFNGSLITTTLWIVFVFVLPTLFNELLQNSLISDLNSNYNLESRKYNIVRDFDLNVLDKMKSTKRAERNKLFKQLNEQFLNIEFKKIKDLEVQAIKDTENTINKIQFFKIFTPCTFINSNVCELSSLGNKAFLHFYTDNLKKQSEMVNFSVMKHFNKSLTINDMNVIFRTKSLLSNHFLFGIVINIIYISVLFFLLYLKFNGYLFPSVKKDFSRIDIKIKNGESVFLYVNNEITDFSNKLFNLSFGNKPNDEIITIDNEPLKGKKVFYLPDLSKLPLDQIKRLSGVSNSLPKKSIKEFNYDDLLTLFPQLEGYDILLIDNISYDHSFLIKNITIVEINSNHLHRDGLFYCINFNKNSYTCKQYD